MSHLICLAVYATLALAAASDCFAQGTLYVCRSGRNFFTADTETGTLTTIGQIGAGVQVSAELVWNCSTQTMYTSQTLANVGVQKNLWRVNPATGAATLVGPFGDTAVLMHGMEFDSRDWTLYGISSHNGGLYRISTATGAATLIGLTGLTGLGSFPQLGFDSDHCVMYATNSITDSLYTIDLATGAASLVGPMNLPQSVSAMTYRRDAASMYLIENSGATPILMSVNLTTGQATTLTTLPNGQNLIGMVWVPSVCPVPCAPACDPDFNSDGSTDQGDVDCLIQVVAGDPECSPNDPDFNADGNVDQGDVDALINVVAGGDCP